MRCASCTEPASAYVAGRPYCEGHLEQFGEPVAVRRALVDGEPRLIGLIALPAEPRRAEPEADDVFLRSLGIAP